MTSAGDWRPGAPVARDVLAGQGGGRRPWEAVPASVRAQTEAWLGSPIVHAESRPGGFSPGVAAVLVTSDGRRVFAKAAGPSPNAETPEFHRREITIARQLPASAPVPQLLWALDDAQTGWVVLLFPEIRGRTPQLPWQSAELERVVRGLAALADQLTPSPLPDRVAGDVRESSVLDFYWTRLAADPARLDGWSRDNLDRLIALETAATSAVTGNTLLNLDIRADNMLLSEDGVVFVDWPHARVGAAWFDVLFFVPSVGMQGGRQPAEVLALYPGTKPSLDELLPAVAAIAGFFTWGALQPPPPGLPHLRAFQDAQGVVARRWLEACLNRDS